MAYVYRHIRLDTNEVFYVGIGVDSEGKYSRANSHQSRNRYWHNVVKKCGRRIEIILDGITWEESLVKEVEWIKHYGRKDIGTGILINLTDGGEGNVGYVTTDEAKAKQRLKKLGKAPPNKGKPMPKEQLARLVAINKGRSPWNKGGKFREESKIKMSVSQKRIARKGQKHHMFGKTHSDELKARWRISRKGDIPWNKGAKMSVEHLAIHKATRPVKAVLQYSLDGNFIAEHRSMADAADIYGIRRHGISDVCIKGKGTYKGYVWRFKKEASEEAVNQAFASTINCATLLSVM